MQKILMFLALTVLCAGANRSPEGNRQFPPRSHLQALPGLLSLRHGRLGRQESNSRGSRPLGHVRRTGDANLERERTILDASSAPGMTGDQKRLGDFYSACMNTAAIEAAGTKPLQPILSRIAAVATRQDLVALLTGMENGGFR